MAPNGHFLPRSDGWDAYHYATKHIIKHVGAHELPNLLPDHLESMYHRMQESGVISWYREPGSQDSPYILERSSNTRLSRQNPVTIAKPPRVEEEEIEPFKRDEITRIFTVALGGRNACHWVIAIALGLRQGEVLGLRCS